MKHIIIIYFLATALFAGELGWSHNYKQALKTAKAEHKLVYVLIVSDTCGWCKKFEKTTLQNQEIKDRLSKKFVTVLLSRDRHNIPANFKTTPIPRHYFVDAQGKILYSSLGYRNEEMFNSFMDNAQENYKKLKDKK